MNEELTLSLDMTATSLMAAGIPIPEQFHGTPLIGPKAKKRDYLFTARDRCDMTVDRIRSVRDKRYNLIRNFMPDRPYTQYNEYILKSYPTLSVMKQLHEQGKLNATQQLFMAPRKPDVELYDLQNDPHEVNNLAAKPEHRKRAADMDRRLQAWLQQMDDKGAVPEKPEAAQL